MIPTILAIHAADLALTLVVLGTYGPAAEANPDRRGVGRP